jgi:hypothetical protein
MKISEIVESRGHKVIATKLADIERKKEPQNGKSPAQMRAEKEQEKKDQKKSSVDEAVDPRLLKYEIKGTKENGQLEFFGTTTDFSGSAMKRAIELLNTTKRAVEVSTKGYDSEHKRMVTVNKVLIEPGDNVKSAVLKLKDNQSVDEGANVSYTVLVGDPETYEKKQIEISALTADHAKKEAESLGYKVFKVSDSYGDSIGEADTPRLVRDRKTGKQYEPKAEFDKLMNSPETRAQMTRMGQEKGKGWPERKK